jgi:hypothetical protein
MPLEITKARTGRSTLEERIAGTRLESASAWSLSNASIQLEPFDVPREDDHDVYLVVVDDLAGLAGSGAKPTSSRPTSRRLSPIEGQYKNPIGIFAFNTAEGWARDASADVAAELRQRCDQLHDLPASLQGFVDRHDVLDRSQFSLPLRSV